MLPIMVGIELAPLQKTQHLACLHLTNHRSQTHCVGVRLRHHHPQPAGNDANHEIAFCPSVQNSVADLVHHPDAVVRIYNLVADFVFHCSSRPPGTALSIYRIPRMPSSYFLWNQRLTENFLAVLAGKLLHALVESTRDSPEFGHL